MFIDWAEHALSDLEEISEHIEQDRSIEAANRISRRIVESVDGLEKCRGLDGWDAQGILGN